MKTCRVLIVEDHPFQHQYLLNLFNDIGGFSVDTAADGRAALECLNRQRYDLILSDLMMPNMDGVQLIQKLGTLKHKPALALMSALSRRMLVSAGLAARSAGFCVIGLISKPVEPAAVHQLRTRLETLDRRGPAIDPQPLALDRASLLAALHNGQVQAWFQPKKSLKDGRIAAAEALVRWNHPELGLLLPGRFLPALQHLDLEEELLMHIIRQTLHAQARWRRHHYEIPVSINLPTHLLDSHDLADRLHALVTTLGGEPRDIGFELMECSTTTHAGNYYAGACRLRFKGFSLAQDDFGKGYSSYFKLASTPFSELKVDRSLVHGCIENESLAWALQSIVCLGRKLGLTVVAEGVETPEELAFLRKIDCHQVQGFLISPAVSEVHFERLLCEDGPAITQLHSP
ncbi:EAL domain-containing protein (putative c-di-GMP-specific phosphodiesterase class I) [Pseudomonas frederiksbergensis]|uniref:EAL domain-containing response regulator n=1 Tax=Pseudomonas frederiksbergensis TaxID=104087 RepID=UPI003D1EBACE